MAYCTLTDIKKEIELEVLVELTDDPVNPSGLVGEANVISAIERADSIINGFLSTRMSVPAEATPTLRTLSTDLAIYTLFSRKENIPDTRAERYNAAMRFLKDFAAGNVNTGVVSDPTGRYPIYSGPETDFDATVWDKY